VQIAGGVLGKRIQLDPLPSPCVCTVLSFPQATPIASTPSQHLLHFFFARPTAVVAPKLTVCLLVKHQSTPPGAAAVDPKSSPQHLSIPKGSDC
jgi:hypothetical protein